MADKSADAAKKIDEYLGKLDGWKQDLAIRIRKAVRSADDRIAEAWKWDTPVWDMSGSVCALAVFKDHVKINFFKGAAISESSSMFNAGLEAKKSRAIDLVEGDLLDDETLVRVVRAAVALNEK